MARPRESNPGPDIGTAAAEASGNFPVDEFRRRLLAWAPHGYQRFPWRKKMPLWKGLMVEVMLQRTRAAQVVPVFEEFDRRYRTAGSLRALDESAARELLAPLGLAWRVPLFALLAQKIAEHRGRLQRNVEGLSVLPGVGPYAASAALSLHAGVRAPIVDSNVVRVICRVLGSDYDGETRRKRWLIELIEILTPDDQHRRFNYGLLDLSMQICLPRKPNCTVCPLQEICATGSGIRAAGSA